MPRRNWAISEGYSQNALPHVNSFVQRLRAAGPSKGINYKRSGGFRGFVGMRLKSKGAHSAIIAAIKKGDAA
jgi:hypothetical protein